MYVGIDLGTTNSLVAKWHDGEAVLIPNALGETLTPSAVSLDDDGIVHVGRAALERQSTHPDRTVTNFKRYMGSARSFRLGGKTFAPEDLSALVLASLKADVEAQADQRISKAIITVPAYFNDRQRKATRRAAELAGLPVARLINEPTAAAMAFGIQNRSDREPFLVFDLGGGTFDVSIVEMFDRIIEVRASAGDNRLGGEDFSDALVSLVKPRLGLGDAGANDPAALQEKLSVAAHATRHRLSDMSSATFEVIIDGTRYATEVTSDEFEQQSAALVTRMREPVLRALRDSAIRADELSDIVLVGGATRMPVVHRAITKLFGRFPNYLVHPDEAVALGAAVQAGLLASDGALDEVRMTDICPYTLGIDVAVNDQYGHIHAGHFSPIIERNQPIPTSRSDIFSTMRDGQTVVECGIYQGESRMVADNVRLGQMKVKVPPGPAGTETVEVRFSYDTSGLLEVDATVLSTGKAYNLVIADDADRAAPGDLEKRRKALAKLKVHPRDDAVNVALLARAERCYEDFLGDRREMIGLAIQAFRSVIAAQDARAIADERERITRFLDEIEAERFL